MAEFVKYMTLGTGEKAKLYNIDDIFVAYCSGEDYEGNKLYNKRIAFSVSFVANRFIPYSMPIEIKDEAEIKENGFIAKLLYTKEKVEQEFSKFIVSHPSLSHNYFAQGLRDFAVKNQRRLTQKQLQCILYKHNSLLEQVLLEEPLIIEKFIDYIAGRKKVDEEKDEQTDVKILELGNKFEKEDWVSTKHFTLHKYNFDKFNPIQSAILNLYDKDINLVIATATSTGKTICAEMVMHYILSVKKQKVLYLSPLKALTREKFDEWKETFKDYDVEILTGDFTVSLDKLHALNDADIICMTAEMMDSKTRKYNRKRDVWVRDIGVVIVDEVHMIGMEDRGATLEAGLMRFTKLNPFARILLLSATVPNPEDFGKWCWKLNGKKTVCIRSEWRPVPLELNYIQYNGDRLGKLIELITNKMGEKFLIFVHTKRDGRSLVKRFTSQTGIEAMFHNADLDKGDRFDIEKRFKTGDLNVLFSTSTLAWGINLPARNVVIMGGMRGAWEVSELDIIQMMGRAGRYGLDNKGFVYFMLKNKKEVERWRYKIENPRPIYSTLHFQSVLGFHILGAVYTGDIITVDDIIKWYKRSLGYIQLGDVSTEIVENVIEDLVKMEMIGVDANKRLRLLPLGKVSAVMYFSPYTIHKWYHNWNTVYKIQKKKDLQDVEKVAIAWAICTAPIYEAFHVPMSVEFDLKDETTWKIMLYVDDYLISNGLDRESVVTTFGMYSILKWGRFVGKLPIAIAGTLKQFIRAVTYDIGRIVTCLQMIDGIKGKWGYNWDYLYNKMVYRVSDELVNLVKLAGIGKVRAEVLAANGIYTWEDIVREEGKVIEILGHDVGYKVIKEAKKKLNTEHLIKTT